MKRDERQSSGGRRRGLRALVAAWTVYWVALVVWALSPPMALFVRLRERMPGRVTIGFVDDLRLRVTLDKATVWAADLSGAEALAWLVGPPLVMWIAWLWWSGRAATRATRAARARVAPAPGAAQLPPPDMVPSAGRTPAAGRVPTPERVER